MSIKSPPQTRWWQQKIACFTQLIIKPRVWWTRGVSPGAGQHDTVDRFCRSLGKKGWAQNSFRYCLVEFMVFKMKQINETIWNESSGKISNITMTLWNNPIEMFAFIAAIFHSFYITTPSFPVTVLLLIDTKDNNSQSLQRPQIQVLDIDGQSKMKMVSNIMLTLFSSRIPQVLPVC